MALLQHTSVRIPEWERRALDSRYFPDRISDCHDLIYRLRAQIQELTVEPDQSDRHGMTRCQYAIYSILKNRAGRIVSKEQMLASFLGAGQCRSSNLIAVQIHKIRKKLPPDEVIENIHGVGFVWKHVEAP